MVADRDAARAVARKRMRGMGLAELVVMLPVLLILLLVLFDFGRLVTSNQIVVDLTREAANVVSRGATFDEAFQVAFRKSGEIDVQAKGGVIISEVRRKDANNATPWIFRQEKRGALASATSKVGKLNAAATIPNVTSLPVGVTIMAVEIRHPFNPLFPVAELGLTFYPSLIYRVGYF